MRYPLKAQPERGALHRSHYRNEQPKLGLDTSKEKLLLRARILIVKLGDFLSANHP